MKLRMSLVALGLLLVPLAGSATAGNGTVDESLTWIDLRAVNGHLYYLGKDGSLWEEYNGAKGLQRARTDYGPTTVKEPDTRLA